MRVVRGREAPPPRTLFYYWYDLILPVHSLLLLVTNCAVIVIIMNRIDCDSVRDYRRAGPADGRWCVVHHKFRNPSVWCGVHHQPRNLNPVPNVLNPKPQPEAKFLGPTQPQP